MARRSWTSVLVAVVLVWSAASGAARTTSSSDDPVEVNRVLLRVNDRIATLHDFEARVAARSAALRRSGELSDDELREELEQVPLAVLKTIWEELLIASRADQLGLVVSTQEVEEAVIEQMRRFQIENTQQLRAALAQEGLTLERFRDSMAMNLLFREVMSRELFPRVRVSEDDLRSIYRRRSADFAVPEQVRVQEIVVLESGDQSAEERIQQAVELLAQWRSGADPKELAEAAGEGVRLLEIGWVAPGDLSPALEAVAWPLEAGEISEPIEARGGVHVVQVIERKAESVRPFEEVREAIAAEERNQKMRTEQEKYLEELEERAYYEANPPQGLEGFRTASGRSLEEGGLGMLDDLSRPDLSQDPSAAEPVDESN